MTPYAHSFPDCDKFDCQTLGQGRTRIPNFAELFMHQSMRAISVELPTRYKTHPEAMERDSDLNRPEVLELAKRNAKA